MNKVSSKNNKVNLENSEDNELYFWKEVEEHSKNLIANLIENNLPISATPKVFDLEKDVDYRVLLRDDLPNFYQGNEDYQTKITQGNWTEGDVEYVAQELACFYWELVLKRLLGDLSSYAGFESTVFAQYDY